MLLFESIIMMVMLLLMMMKRKKVSSHGFTIWRPVGGVVGLTQFPMLDSLSPSSILPSTLRSNDTFGEAEKYIWKMNTFLRFFEGEFKNFFPVVLTPVDLQ